MSGMYSHGSFLRAGHSDVRIMYSLSKRWIMNGIQASPLSSQITLSFGKRSGSALMIQLAMCTMLYQTKPSACTEMNWLSMPCACSCQW